MLTITRMPGRRQRATGCRRREERRPEVEPDQRIEAGGIDLVERPVEGPAGVVDEDVEATERVARPGDEVRGRRQVGEVGGQAHGGPAAGRDGRRGRLASGGVAVVMERDRGPAVGEPDGDRPADADPGARHERAAAVEPGVVGARHLGQPPTTTRDASARRWA